MCSVQSNRSVYSLHLPSPHPSSKFRHLSSIATAAMTMSRTTRPSLIPWVVFLLLILVAVHVNAEGTSSHEHKQHEQHNHSTSASSSTGRHPNHTNPPNLFTLWLYGTGAVVFISICGLLAIMTIPKIASHHHSDILQLLVGLAIGTLTSDALLHLLPHAFSGETHRDHEKAEQAHDDENHFKSLCYGLMALVGIIGFLAFERILTIVSDLWKDKSHGRTTKVGNCNNRAAGPREHSDSIQKEKELAALEKPILNDEHERTEEAKNGLGEKSEVPCMSLNSDNKNAPITSEQCHRETTVYQHPDPDRGYVIQLTDHHHHHQHQSHAQRGAKSVIYMIITGDGVHNFCDGLAIGVAFAGGGIGGGISTSVAVLCHELPHEVGDFAVLLKAGLAVRKAVMYNTLSAFLCFIGMTVGVYAAELDTGMLSSIIAGMFLYIALVDMIPQLDCCPTAAGTTRAFKLSVQLFGMGIGVSIMSVISIYESKLQRLLK